ncbi:hypothetical protein IV203_011825 [Nitzschia inconspicua]|uniref:Uncharacterized protein n=1 Tax=Nitzschia inconspicua TaxID=303405 RepID=A0A9K3PJ10_9STRA|nr:hypothetical protein IV203_011825 [Nitzschia inconspicua]
MAIDEPFEYLTFGATFSRTFGLFFDRLDLFCAITGIVLVPFVILVLTMGIFAFSVFVREEEIPDFHPKHIPLIVFVVFLQGVAYEVATVLGQGAISKAVAMIYVGQQPTWVGCLRDSFKRTCTLLGSSILIYGTLFVACLPPLIFLLVVTTNPNVLTIILAVVTCSAFVVVGSYGFIGVSMTKPAIMIEGFTNPLQGVMRSWELANGSRCYLMCTLFCLWLMSDLLTRLLHNMFVMGDILDAVFSIVGIIVSVVPLLLFFPLHAIMQTVLYLNLRIGRESMNHQVLSGDLAIDAASPASRFRNDDPTADMGQSMDYRHVPLVDADDNRLDENLAPLAQQNLIV